LWRNDVIKRWENMTKVVLLEHLISKMSWKLSSLQWEKTLWILYLFRFVIIRIILLFLYLIQSFFGGLSVYLYKSFQVVHYFDNLFFWLCEHNYLTSFLHYKTLTDVMLFTNGIWTLLFVITGSQFLDGLKKA
jgi:hypothetical protein